MPMFSSFSKILLGGMLSQQHARRIRVENLETREIVEEELIRFLESTRTRACSAGRLRRQEPHNWRTCTGNGALSEVAQNMYLSSMTTSTDRENSNFEFAPGHVP